VAVAVAVSGCSGQTALPGTGPGTGQTATQSPSHAQRASSPAINPDLTTIAWVTVSAGNTGNDGGAGGGGGGSTPPIPCSDINKKHTLGIAPAFGGPCGGGTNPGPVSGSGGGTVSTQTGLLQGCGSKVKTAGSAYSAIGNASSVWNTPKTGQNGSEAYGFVAQSTSDGSFAYTNPVIDTTDGNGSLNIGPPPTIPGYVVVGIYHTHWFNPTNPQGLDVNTQDHFSVPDQGYAAEYNLTMFVGIDDTTPSNDTDQPRWYSYDPTSQKETPQGLLGSGGC
jgi:hypothetical protein